MRQRKLKNLDEKLNSMREYIIEPSSEQEYCLQAAFDGNTPLYTEVGCGKGKFITSMAIAYPERNYIGIEGHLSVLYRAMEKIQECDSHNVKFAGMYIRDLRDCFKPESLNGLYLNFSDPWPKVRHEKRRLTHRNFLAGYMETLVHGGFIQFKTDNDGLFDFTLDEIAYMQYEVSEVTRDLHSSSYDARLFTTEYEDKFKGIGKNINYVKFVKP